MVSPPPGQGFAAPLMARRGIAVAREKRTSSGPVDPLHGTGVGPRARVRLQARAAIDSTSFHVGKRPVAFFE